MYTQVAVFGILLAVAHAGLLLEQGIGLGGGYGGYGGDSGYSGYGGYGISTYGGYGGKETVIDVVAPPKYEFKYGVDDYKTGDRKEQAESRIEDLTKSEYAVAEKDRKIQVSRIIAGSVPVKIVGKY